MCVICVTFICLTWGLIDISMLEKCALAIQPYAELNVLSVCVCLCRFHPRHIYNMYVRTASCLYLRVLCVLCKLLLAAAAYGVVSVACQCMYNKLS